MLGAVVLACLAMRPPPPPLLEMKGACAAVKQSETWKGSNGQPNWTYRVKVAPWTLFGQVKVELHGWDMMVRRRPLPNGGLPPTKPS